MNLAPASVMDYRELARRKLPRQLFDYIDGGAYAESTMRANVSDLRDIHLRQRILRDGSHIDLGIDVLGARYSDTRNGMMDTIPGAKKLLRAWDILSHFGWVTDVAMCGKPLTFGNLEAAVPGARSPAGFKAASTSSRCSHSAPRLVSSVALGLTPSPAADRKASHTRFASSATR